MPYDLTHTRNLKHKVNTQTRYQLTGPENKLTFARREGAFGGQVHTGGHSAAAETWHPARGARQSPLRVTFTGPFWGAPVLPSSSCHPRSPLRVAFTGPFRGAPVPPSSSCHPWSCLWYVFSCTLEARLIVIDILLCFMCL